LPVDDSDNLGLIVRLIGRHHQMDGTADWCQRVTQFMGKDSDKFIDILPRKFHRFGMLSLRQVLGYFGKTLQFS
jgi:hypothetical protein